jgi:hypothetical protein
MLQMRRIQACSETAGFCPLPERTGLHGLSVRKARDMVKNRPV